MEQTNLSERRVDSARTPEIEQVAFYIGNGEGFYEESSEVDQIARRRLALYIAANFTTKGYEKRRADQSFRLLPFSVDLEAASRVYVSDDLNVCLQCITYLHLDVTMDLNKPIHVALRFIIPVLEEKPGKFVFGPIESLPGKLYRKCL